MFCFSFQGKALLLWKEKMVDTGNVSGAPAGGVHVTTLDSLAGYTETL
jgi:hypothetical protein